MGYTAVAQQNQPTTEPTPGNQPTTEPTQGNQPTTQPNAARISAADRQFMISAAQDGIAEVVMGQLAADRAVTNEVKQYGQRLVDHHRQANTQLMQLAAEKGVTLPTEMDAKHKALRARLGQIPGRRFDETFVREMAKDHSQVVSMFQRQAQRGQDPDVRSFATNTLPTLREHWQVARSLTNSIARGGRSGQTQ